MMALLWSFQLSSVGDIPGLFVALWRSNTFRKAESSIAADDSEDEDDVAGEDEEDEAEILNNVTDEKLAGYQWIHQGCQFIGPVRDRADTDW